MNYQLALVALLLVVSIVDATLVPSKKGKKAAKELKTKQGPQPSSVLDRNLVEEEPAARDILVEHATYFRDTDRRLFDGTVLGYVTPVNIYYFIYMLY